MKSDFMLKSKLAVRFYNNYAKDLPIIDYHNHLDPQKIAVDYKFTNIFEMWIEKDHYKYRALRSLGIDEEFITGDKSNELKFNSWRDSINLMVGNPLYHWSILELDNFFKFDGSMTEFKNNYTYDQMNKLIEENSYSTQSIMKKFKVEVCCTTDDPLDSLEYHQVENDVVKVLPTFRPDKLFYVDNEGFSDYLNQLEMVTELKITNSTDLIKAIEQRIIHFKQHGCVIADHGMTYLKFAEFSEDEIDEILNLESSSQFTEEQVSKFFTFINLNLAILYKKYDIKLQIHFGALRNINKVMFDKLGADSGYDAMNDDNISVNLASLLNIFKENNALVPTIIYNLNPVYNDAICSIIGAFNEGPTKSLVQFGSGWWFNDTKVGMEKQLSTLASTLQLSTFVGMLTDSRSFMSFVRHDYFRRILCNYFAEQVNDGEIIESEEFVGQIISNICYYNIKEFLGL